MTRIPALATLAALSLACAGPGGSQESPSPDVASIDAIVTALYDVISGPAGEVRDWDRFRGLFLDGARLVPTGRAPDGTARHGMMSPEEYVQGVGPRLEQDGFYETEIGRIQESFGQIAHLFSSYESKRSPDDAEPFARGINSIQLFNDGERWWIVTVLWDSEREGTPIPQRYIGR